MEIPRAPSRNSRPARRASSFSVDQNLLDNGLFPAAVEVRLADGHSDIVRCDIPPGAPAMPMSDAEADQKYRSCAGVVLDGPAIERTRAMILGIDRLADVGELCVALEEGAMIPSRQASTRQALTRRRFCRGRLRRPPRRRGRRSGRSARSA